MATASSESGAAPAPGRSSALASAWQAHREARPIMAVRRLLRRLLPVLGIFDRLVRHPALHPAEAVGDRDPELRPISTGWSTTPMSPASRPCIGYIAGGGHRGAARPCHRLLVDPAADHLSVLRQPRDDAEDRLRAAVHLVARLRAPAQGDHRLSRLLLPDRAQRHPRLRLAAGGTRALRARQPAPGRSAPS